MHVSDFLDLLRILENCNQSFITFTSDASILPHIIEYYHPTLTSFCDEKITKTQAVGDVKKWEEIAYIKNKH